MASSVFRDQMLARGLCHLCTRPLGPRDGNSHSQCRAWKRAGKKTAELKELAKKFNIGGGN